VTGYLIATPGMDQLYTADDVSSIAQKYLGKVAVEHITLLPLAQRIEGDEVHPL